MDCCFPELLTREEVVRILKERQLQIPNLDDLPEEEVKRLYTTFAMPLARREVRPNSSSKCAWPQTGAPQQDCLLHATKRPITLNAHLDELDLYEKSIAKRSKLLNSNGDLKKHLPECFIDCAGKRRKMDTTPGVLMIIARSERSQFVNGY